MLQNLLSKIYSIIIPVSRKDESRDQEKNIIRIPRKLEYYQVHEMGCYLTICRNNTNRSTLLSDAPIFLTEEDGWQWLMKNYPKYVVPKIGVVL